MSDPPISTTVRLPTSVMGYLRYEWARAVEKGLNGVVDNGAYTGADKWWAPPNLPDRAPNQWPSVPKAGDDWWRHGPRNNVGDAMDLGSMFDFPGPIPSTHVGHDGNHMGLPAEALPGGVPPYWPNTRPRGRPRVPANINLPLPSIRRLAKIFPGLTYLEILEELSKEAPSRARAPHDRTGKWLMYYDCGKRPLNVWGVFPNYTPPNCLDMQVFADQCEYNPATGELATFEPSYYPYTLILGVDNPNVPNRGTNSQWWYVDPGLNLQWWETKPEPDIRQGLPHTPEANEPFTPNRPGVNSAANPNWVRHNQIFHRNAGEPDPRNDSPPHPNPYENPYRNWEQSPVYQVEIVSRPRPRPGPSTPIVPRPGEPPVQHVRQPPGKRVQERKVLARGQLASQAVLKALDAASEASDFLESLYKALPAHIQRRYDARIERANRGVGGRYESAGIPIMLEALARHWRDLDAAQAVTNVINNEIEDQVIGRGHGARSRLTYGSNRNPNGRRSIYRERAR